MTDAAAALLHASGLPGRWRGRERFVVLAAGPGAAHAFVAAWKMWRDDPRRCERLDVIALDSRAAETAGLHAPPVGAAAADLARQLADAWPPLTPNLHRLAFEEGRVQLLLLPGEPADGLREIVARIDLFLIFGSDDREPDLLDRAPRSAKTLARLAAPAATLVAGRIDAAAAAALEAAGFRIEAPGSGIGVSGSGIAAFGSGVEAFGSDIDGPGTAIGSSGSGIELLESDIETFGAGVEMAPDAHAPGPALARYAPRFVPRPAIARRPQASAAVKRAVIVGAGLAGCATAWALAEHGWRSIVLERHRSIASEASGNPAGLFHGIVNGQDGTHARFNRAAALEAHTAATQALAQHAVRGGIGGLLQLVDAQASITAMRAVLRRLQLPGSYVQALDSGAASERAGLRVSRPAWFYPGGGWIEPGGLARSFVERAAASVDLRVGVEVTRLRRDGATWQLLDASGEIIESADTVVLANAGEALRLAGGAWPVEKVRGQISMLAAAEAHSIHLPRLPITGAGYLLPAIDGVAIFGATSGRGDDDPAVRFDDHAQNLEQLARLAPASGAASIAASAGLHGRTGWRWVSRDRLPLIGAVPRGLDAAAATHSAASMRLDQPRFVPREPGLFMFTALGSRGITWAALGAQVLAAQISGAPAPVEASLLDALDPARFLVRESRRSDTR